MQTKVYIWDSKHDSFGHASMTLSDGTHISWWPSSGSKRRGAGQSGFLSLLALTFLTTARCSESLDEDIALEEERQPDYVFTLTNQIDEYAIRRWWMSNKNGTFFSGLFKNCCSVVFQALREGSVLQFIPEHDRKKWEEIIVWHPNYLKDFLERLSGHLNVLCTKNRSITSTEHEMQKWMTDMSEKQSWYFNKSVDCTTSSMVTKNAKDIPVPLRERETGKATEEIKKNHPEFVNECMEHSCRYKGKYHTEERYGPIVGHETRKTMQRIPPNPEYSDETLEWSDNHSDRNCAKGKHIYSSESKALEMLNKLPYKKTEDVNESFGCSDNYTSMNKANASVNPSGNNENMTHAKDGYSFSSEHETLKRMNEIPNNKPGYNNEFIECSDNHNVMNHAKDIYSPALEHEMQKGTKGMPGMLSGSETESAERSFIHNDRYHAKDRHRSFSECETLERINKLYIRTPEDVNESFGYSDNHMSTNEAKERYSPTIRKETWPRMKKIPEEQPVCANGFVDRSNSSANINDAKDKHSFSSECQTLKKMNKLPENKPEDLSRSLGCSDNHMSPRQGNKRYTVPIEPETRQRGKQITEKQSVHANEVVERSHSSANLNHAKERCSFSSGNETLKNMTKIPEKNPGDDNELIECYENHKDMNHIKVKHSPAPKHEKPKRMKEVSETQYGYLTKYVECLDSHSDKNRVKDRYSSSPKCETQNSMIKLPGMEEGSVIESVGRPNRKKSLHRSRHKCIPCPNHNTQRISKITEKETENIKQSLILSDNNISTDQAKEGYNPTSSQEKRASMKKLTANQIGDNSASVRPSDSSMNMNQTTNIYDGFREWVKPRKRKKKKPKGLPGCMNESLGLTDSDMSANHANDGYYPFQQNDNGSMNDVSVVQPVYLHESDGNSGSQECKGHATNMYRILPKAETRQRKKGVTEKQPRHIKESVDVSEGHTTMNRVDNTCSDSNYRTVCVVLFTVVVVLVVSNILFFLYFISR